jgi:pimeloyl-ACP methyl ester carboxylesterase
VRQLRHPDDRSLWTVERFMEELDAVRDALGLDRVHLFGSSWGGMLAMQYVLDRGRPPVSLITAGSPASCRRWNEICQELLDEMPADEREVAERIPGSRLEIIPDASHLWFVERPDLWMPIANEFMAAAEAGV